MTYDFEDELRGDEGPMNEKSNGIVPAIIVGVILTVSNIFITKVSDDSGEKNTAEKLATLTERVTNLSDQVRKLSEQPFVRREEFGTVENRVTGLEQRVGVIERSGVVRGR